MTACDSFDNQRQGISLMTKNSFDADQADGLNPTF